MVDDIQPLEKNQDFRSSGFRYLKSQEPVRFYTVGIREEDHEILTSSIIILDVMMVDEMTMSRIQCGGRTLHSNNFIHGCARTCNEELMIDIVDPKQKKGFRLVISQASLCIWKQIWAEIEEVATIFRLNGATTLVTTHTTQPAPRPMQKQPPTIAHDQRLNKKRSITALSSSASLSSSTSPARVGPSFLNQTRVNPSSSKMKNKSEHMTRVALQHSLLALNHEKVRLDIQQARLEMQKAKSDMAKNRFDVLYTLFSTPSFRLDKDKKKATQEKLVELAQSVLDDQSLETT